MMSRRLVALELLYRELKKAKISLAHAEGRRNNQEERDNLVKRIVTLDWLTETILNLEEDDCE